MLPAPGNVLNNRRFLPESLDASLSFAADRAYILAVERRWR
jgi:hypothetical protein